MFAIITLEVAALLVFSFFISFTLFSLHTYNKKKPLERDWQFAEMENFHNNMVTAHYNLVLASFFRSGTLMREFDEALSSQ